MSQENEIPARSKLQSRLRVSAWLIASGLTAAALSLWMRRPLGLLISMGLACTLAGIGMVLYLYSVVSISES